MKILVVNCGSSSIKSAIIHHRTGKRLASFRIDRIGEPEPQIRVNHGDWELAEASNHEEALKIGFDRMMAALPDDVVVTAVGHRVVHGGDAFDRPVVINDEVEAAILEMTELAPLHNPANLSGIRAARALLPDVTHVAVFDTAFHTTLPRRAREYAIPMKLAEEKGIKRFGFHGISHAFVSQLAADYMEEDLRDVRVITCHLGNGCSLAAVEYGRSVETSMGMTPLEGLVMGTRAGDIDAGVVIDLMRDGMSADEIDHLLNRESGLVGLSGVSNDMRDIEERAAEGDEACRRAIQVFAHRVRKYIGAYAAVMGGVDAIVFTAGIGENSAAVRHRIAQRLEFLGARFNEDLNRAVDVNHENPVAEISTRNSRTRLLVAATDEQLQIARNTARLVLECERTTSGKTIPVAISGRHVHLTRESVESLFGPGY